MEVLGVDIGGSNLKAGRVVNGEIEKKSIKPVKRGGTYDQVLHDLFNCIDEVITQNTKSIGIGVPAVVDPLKGIAYNVQNIPSWEIVPLKQLLIERYGLLVHLNNDANCFALGEKIYGRGLHYKNFVGLSLGTGIGMGIIINESLYNGVLCGAGEIGMIAYKESIMEHYASSFFFTEKYGLHPIEVFERAEQGNPESIIAFQEYGFHLGEAIKTILYLYAPEAIIIGGSISKAYKYFQESLQTNLKAFAYSKQIENLKIEVSTKNGSPILGAAALCLQ
ncbi:glucokinase [Gillisia sp. Hel_I_86]|uniref:ROK family protein n=1 Tax=Gillisia sp. Hel_I_86 TaxID=1249981 RepID=UPI0011997B82|nr:ROK family protein [Gillisia sp. Hel_I_86]TVZ27181.1 glucokinase [Gillisia sp. Hel_I_86]